MSKNIKLLKDFVKYCQEHPNQRFWQALRNWCGYAFILVKNHKEELKDTFYWEGKDK